MLIDACCSDDRNVLQREEAVVSEAGRRCRAGSSTGSMPSDLRSREAAPWRTWCIAGAVVAGGMLVRGAFPRGAAVYCAALCGLRVRRRSPAACTASWVSGVPSAGSSSPTIYPPRMTSTRSAMPMISGSSRGDDDDSHAGCGQLVDDTVDFRLGADIDPAGRLVEDQHPRLRSAAGATEAPSADCRRKATRPG